jgi:hypothetical protein
VPGRRGEAHEVADDTTADGDQRAVAPGLELDQPVLDLCLGLAGLTFLTAGQGQGLDVEPLLGKTSGQRPTMERHDPHVGNDEQEAPGRVADEIIDEGVQHALTDANTTSPPRSGPEG